MAYEHKPGNGAIFKNKDKNPGDNKPDYKGDGMGEQGNLVEFALWVKDGTNGKYFSVKMSRKQQQPQERPTQRQQPTPPKPDESLPF